jgi:hypothetical protein
MNMRKLYATLLLSVSVVSLMAQPTITTSWVPTSGKVNHTVQYNTTTIPLSEGLSGTGVTWSFAGVDTTGSVFVSYVAPSTAPYHVSFAGATDCAVGAGVYTYDALSGSTYQLAGTYQVELSDTITDIYGDPLDYYRFPLSYSATFTDQEKDLKYDNSVLTDKVLGTETVTADGYGTLTTNAGTFTNVLRIHTHLVQIDTSYSFGTFSSADSLLTDTYTWLSASYPGVILNNVTHFSQDGFNTDLGYYTVNPTFVNGISTIADAGISHWSLAPQPASDAVTLMIDNTTNDKEATVLIYDLTGRLLTTTTAHLTTGNHNITINTSTLANGMYTVSLMTEGKTDTKKLVVRN